MQRAFTGRHMAAIMVAFFGVVIVVNLLNARLASSTFGGEVVENSYVASQDFNRWLVANGKLASNHYMDSLQFGTELYNPSHHLVSEDDR